MVCGGPALLVLTALLFTGRPTHSLDYVGCLFEDLCEENERCFNDAVFGRCVSNRVNDADLRSAELSADDISELVDLLEVLVVQGHKWSHIYTQCVLQTKLLSLQTGVEHDGSACEIVNNRPRIPPGSHGVPALSDNDSDQQQQQQQLEQQQQQQQPEQVPSADSDEDVIRYGPPPDQLEAVGGFSPAATYRGEDQPIASFDDRQMPPNWDWGSIGGGQVEDVPENTFDEADQLLYYPVTMKRNSLGRDFSLSYNLETPLEAYFSRYPNDVNPELTEDEAILLEPSDGEVGRELSRELMLEARQEQERLAREPGPSLAEEIIPMIERGRFGPPNDIELDPATLEDLEFLKVLPDDVGGKFYPDMDARDPDDILDVAPHPEIPVDYPDSGYLDPSYPDYPEYGDYLDPITLSVRSDPEFQRAERLDIKKPGPWFGINNFAFDYEFDGKGPRTADELAEAEVNRLNAYLDGSNTQIVPDDALAVDSESEQVDQLANDVTPSTVPPTEPAPTVSEQEQTNSQLKKSSESKFSHYPDPRESIDTSYTFLKTRERFPFFKDGQKLVSRIAEKMGLPYYTFDKPLVDGDIVTFRVNPNVRNYNASQVAATIAKDLRPSLNEELGINIIATGVGDARSASAAHVVWRAGDEVVAQKDNNTFFVQTLTIVFGALLAAILFIVLVVCFLRRRARSKNELKGLANPDAEASKDYQELCRARMAARVTEKAESSEKPQRVHSLSKESDNGMPSPSSRSSTSSWSEEPVVSNMDISTGHMVLSYMEDHLKKKDKLDEEWRALCAYEAEPSARTVAELPENIKKNRSADVLPYDHSRLVLNAVTNATGSDYINASTITDHDPRNPAYIATQGPLPNTSNDFWQMVWEQGSVVIVMLTRLTENGVGMCHRYWPEEGSELYHIYEVHLVSEHIWCDEYLVRSFYLKNLKTSETRTVTQFHFLAWPENGVPTSTKALLEFRRKVNKSYRGRSCPVIVHCSDGAGRTGTYCLIDMVLNRMSKGAKEIDIAATLEHIRDQRPACVRTRGQFEFVLMAVAEEVHAILKALPQ